MTGYGRASASSPKKKITVEIKSLNSKQLDLSMRVPSYFRELEVDCRNRISAGLERGKVDFLATCENIGAEGAPTLNVELVKAYKAQIEELDRAAGLEAPADWHAVLLRLPDVLHTEAAELSDEDVEAFRSATLLALDALREFRATEGEKLYHFFKEKIDNIGRLLREVEQHETARVAKIRARLQDQLERIPQVEYDKGRLEQELIFYIEKLDISEEKQRLSSHLTYFMQTMDGSPEGERAAGKGKKLGFIAQEMGREINTLGSKSNNAEMQIIVVQMKDELEQIKEQVLNVL